MKLMKKKDSMIKEDISKNLNRLKESIPEDITLVAVSKTRSLEEMMEAYHAGQRIFGENRIQELESKQKQMPADVKWHMIGHVQRNKVKDMAAFVDLIHGVDRLRLLRQIDREAKNNNRVINCLLQIKIAEEESKFGMTEEEALNLLASEEFKKMENVKILGLMGMATFTEDTEQVSAEFAKLKKFYDRLKDSNRFSVLSMGMTGDYELALQNGSNMIRIGSAIFGERTY